MHSVISRTQCLSRTQSVFPGHNLPLPDIFFISRKNLSFPDTICLSLTQSVFPGYILYFPDTVCLSRIQSVFPRTYSLFPGRNLSFPETICLSRTQSVFPGHILYFPDTVSFRDKIFTFVVPLEKLSGLVAIHLSTTKKIIIPICITNERR